MCRCMCCVLLFSFFGWTQLDKDKDKRMKYNEKFDNSSKKKNEWNLFLLPILQKLSNTEEFAIIWEHGGSNTKQHLLIYAHSSIKIIRYRKKMFIRDLALMIQVRVDMEIEELDIEIWYIYIYISSLKYEGFTINLWGKGLRVVTLS